MNSEFGEVLKRMDSRLLSQLWSFYRDSFSNDDTCLKFIYSCIKDEPIIDKKIFVEDQKRPGVFVSEDGELFHDDVFIPRRMLNSVARLVVAARDMDQIRRGKDVFKIVFLVTCVETLQHLSGKKDSKKGLLFSFFNDYTSNEDKRYISKRFMHDDGDLDEDTFQCFIGVINEYRNCAAHEGDYWNYCFNNNADKEEWPSILSVRINLEEYSCRNKKEHGFRTQLSYKEFEEIFIRTCISFINRYVEGRSDSSHI